MDENSLGIRDKIPGYQWIQQDHDNPHENRSLNVVSNPGPPEYIVSV